MSNIADNFQSQIAQDRFSCTRDLAIRPLPIKFTLSCLLGSERCVQLLVFGTLCTTPGIKIETVMNGPRSDEPWRIKSRKIGFFGNTLTDRLILGDKTFRDIDIGFDICWDPTPARCNSGVAVNTCDATYGGKPCESCTKSADGGAVFVCEGIEFAVGAPSFPSFGGEEGSVVIPDLTIISMPDGE